MLKIEGFDGKFGRPEGSTVQPVQKDQAAVRTIGGVSKVRPDSSFKIKDSLRQASEVQAVVKPQAAVVRQKQVQAREAVDAGRVNEATKAYLTAYKPDPTVTLALTTHLPLVEGEKITFLADNQLQLDKLQSLKVQLQTAFMKTLNNGFISLEFKLFDTGITHEEKKLFTSGEKFDHFVKLNPVVAELKNIFGLELD